MCDGQVLCGSGLSAKLALEADRQVHCQRRTKGRKLFADLLIIRVELYSTVSQPISCRKFSHRSGKWDGCKTKKWRFVLDWGLCECYNRILKLGRHHYRAVIYK